MKSLRFAMVVGLTFLGGAVFAQSKTESIKVLGNCGMCKKTIETSLKVPGVSSANWDTETKILKVSYDSAKITNDEVQKKVAAVGYDTPKYKAKNEVYDALHGCCQYDREAGDKLPKAPEKH
ncbi:heavy-metal-associated domain-containing protein [Pedobacter sp. PLR]|uniref:heavy-metal-associated domain-containing protein n=1 Tax=Pedobacter sp. PLR TaxID=2994465 RepID=UPI002247C539|nr:heavy-metal-associated domain-containing protein [Pedobacter sp. PLR]MCX2454114.1 heavy-metal-associated domain-containing protein [Pedobacter sp. PLR]